MYGWMISAILILSGNLDVLKIVDYISNQSD